jgi:hypothetical protein
MPQPNYKQIETLLELHEPFKHGYSMSAERDELGVYYVYSYGTQIASYALTHGTWWINPNKYSVTTSKQQNIIRRVATRQGWREPLSV